ncbi:MAG: FecR domain-containing protein [Ignavibacteriae bacterium]|nr:FecR domain-containing protein [Ignavibacteriota bacterium]
MLRFLRRQRIAKTKISLEDEQTIDRIIRDDSTRIRHVDPDTSLQWLRLRRAMDERAVSRSSRRLVPRFAFGAALVAAIVVGVYFYKAQAPTSVETFVTNRGEQTHVLLRDSSDVTLNSASQLIIADMQTGRARKLTLAGEAFFRVRHNNTPFIVETGIGNVQVVGTEFNVRVREELLEVSVVRGRVNVTASISGTDSVLSLAQGQMAICTKGSHPSRGRDIVVADFPGWMYGKLYLNATSFEAACREIEMRFDVIVHIDDKNVRREIITGRLAAPSADAAIAALCKLTGNTMRHDEDGYHIR